MKKKSILGLMLLSSIAMADQPTTPLAVPQSSPTPAQTKLPAANVFPTVKKLPEEIPEKDLRKFGPFSLKGPGYFNTEVMGFAAGNLPKDSPAKSLGGWHRAFGITSNEDDLYLGDSTPMQPTDDQKECKEGKILGCASELIPFHFSVRSDNPVMLSRLKEFQGENVVVKFRVLRLKWPNSIFYGTDIRGLSAILQNPNLVPPTCVATTRAEGPFIFHMPENNAFERFLKNNWLSHWLYLQGMQSIHTSKTARIVMIARTGQWRKSYEALVQMKGAGNHFINVSLYDHNIANCAFYWMVSGREAKMTFDQTTDTMTNPMNRMSTYEVLKIEPKISQDEAVDRFQGSIPNFDGE